MNGKREERERKGERAVDEKNPGFSNTYCLNEQKAVSSSLGDKLGFYEIMNNKFCSTSQKT